MILRILGYAVAVSLVFCIHFIIRKHKALKNSDQFEGTVIGYEPHRGSKGTTYALRIEYRDQQSRAQVFTASGASSPPARPIGAKVLVFQHRDGGRPDILVFESVYLGLWIWFCFGMCVIGCLMAPYVLDAVYKK
jgi:hypothetical protein